MGTSDFLIGLPKFLTNRFNSVNKYVWETLFPEKIINELISKKKTKFERKKELERIKSISDEASIIVFLFLINKFFRDGSKAAKLAVDTFTDLDVKGFYIGNNFFSGRNEKVVQGDKISELLINSLRDEKAKALVTKSNYVSEIFDEYRKVI